MIINGPWTLAERMRNRSAATYLAALRRMNEITPREPPAVRIHPAVGRQAVAP